MRSVAGGPDGQWFRALQLDSDPFAEPGPLFSGAGRKQLLRQAVQQLHFGGSGDSGGGCVALAGELGSGVSTLLAAAREQLNGIADTVALSAAGIAGPTALCDILSRVMGTGPVADPAGLIAAWQKLKPEDGSALPLALLIDDAHRLPEDVLGSLTAMAVAASGDLRLLLGGEPQLLHRLTTTGINWRCLRLPALDRNAVADYLLTRLQAAGYAGELPLDGLQLDALAEHSGGVPGRIQSLLPRLLTPVSAAVPSPGSKLPVVHLVAAAGLLAAIAVALLYWSGDERGGEPPAQHQSISEPEPSDPEPRQLEPAPQQMAQAAPAAVPDRSLPQSSGSAEAASTSASTAPADAALEAPEAAPTPASPTGDATAESAMALLSDDERALLALPDGSYLLQLFAARDAQRVAHFAESAASALRIYRFETRLSGAPWFVAVAGPYPDAARARAVAAALPAALRTARPWPRPQAEVAAAIRARAGQ